MKLSELIAKLQEQLVVQGDVGVYSERTNEYGDIDEYTYMHPPVVYVTKVRRRHQDWKIEHTIVVVK